MIEPFQLRMMMAAQALTTNDLCKRTGLGYFAVRNVLNGQKGGSVENREKVIQTLESGPYEFIPGGVQLKQGGGDA